MSIIDNLKKKTFPSKDFIYKNVYVNNNLIYLIYNEVLTSSLIINDIILKKLYCCNEVELNNINLLFSFNSFIINNDDILYYLNQGFLVIIYNNKVYCIEARNTLERGVTSVTSELSVTGPKDSFSESYNTNLGLIRKRIKSEKLCCFELEIGRITKTKVGILYMNNIVNKKTLNSVINKLNKIDIDGIIDSSYLKNHLENKSCLFPTIMLTERPDKSCMSLLEGKLVILIDTSPYVIILPNFFIDFFHTVDDYYQKPINITFIRIIRIIAFIIAIYTPALYISITTRNYDLIPRSLLLTLKAGRSFVPFPAYVEAFLMILSFEILKESDLRMSNTSNSSISILGGLILGDAAVAAGILSPIMIIVIAISSIAGLVFNSLELVNAIRIYKIIFLIIASFFGIYGVLIITLLLIYKLSNLKNYDTFYLAPIIPYIKSQQYDSILKKDKKIKTRNPSLTTNYIRGKEK